MPETKTQSPGAEPEPPEGSRGIAPVPVIPFGEFAGLGRDDRAVRFLTLCAAACEPGQVVQISKELILHVLKPGAVDGAADHIEGPRLPRMGEVVAFDPEDGSGQVPAVVTRVHSEFCVSCRVLPHDDHCSTFSRRLVQKTGSQHRGQASWDFLPSI